MNGAAVKVISSYAVRSFIEAGGMLRYRIGKDEDGRYWEVYGVDQYDNELPVIIGRSGLPKRLRSADAVVNYHKTMFPHLEEVTLPLPEDEDPSED